jgi:hypothetical protein
MVAFFISAKLCVSFAFSAVKLGGALKLSSMLLFMQHPI